MKDYFYNLCQKIPISVFEGLASILCIGIVLIVITKGWEKGGRLICGLVLFEYIVLVYLSTVFYRDYSEAKLFKFFWSYKSMSEWGTSLLIENIMNVIAFFPIGFLIGATFKRIKWWLVFLIGFIVSFFIEFLQFVLNRGVSEFDDIFHNVLGCMLGFGFFCILRSIIHYCKNKIH